MDLALPIPPDHTLVSVAERPDVWGPMNDLDDAVWPEFMKHDPVANRLWPRLRTSFGAHQLALLDAGGAVVAAQNAAPIAWDGTVAGLPDGWDDQFVRSVTGIDGRIPATALGALQVVVRADRRGRGLAVLMLEAMRANAIAHGLRSVLACVRPTQKADYPLIPIEAYSRWTRPDGLPFDAWIRIHARLGGRIVRGSPRSMTIPGSVADWRAWTGLTFPGSGDYLLPGATSVLTIDVERDIGIHHDENVWMIHDLA
jgi:GNAT superfamily N-acetyltransferase